MKHTHPKNETLPANTVVTVELHVEREGYGKAQVSVSHWLASHETIADAVRNTLPRVPAGWSVVGCVLESQYAEDVVRRLVRMACDNVSYRDRLTPERVRCELWNVVRPQPGDTAGNVTPAEREAMQRRAVEMVAVPTEDVALSRVAQALLRQAGMTAALVADKRGAGSVCGVLYYDDASSLWRYISALSMRMRARALNEWTAEHLTSLPRVAAASASALQETLRISIVHDNAGVQ